MIRITGGQVRGRKLFGPKGLSFRPTTGQVKEYIFSVVASEIENAWVLDLFSGTGSLGIEALSRGAERVIFVEKSIQNISLIRKNLKICGLLNRAQIVQGDVFYQLKDLRCQKDKFDFIIADPPFKENLRGRIVHTVWKYQILKDGGLLILEHESHDTEKDNHHYQLIRQKRFGQSIISFYGSSRS